MKKANIESSVYLSFLSKNRKVVIKWVKLLIITGIFGILFSNIPTGDLRDVFNKTNIGLVILGVFLSYISVFVYTIFLWIVVQEKKIQIKLIKLYFINLGIKFYSLFSPTSLVGSGIRIFRLSQNNRVEDALSAITFSRLVDTAVTLIDGAIWIVISLYFDKFNLWWLVIFLLFLVCFWLIFLKISSPIIRGIDWIINSNNIHIYIKRIILFLKKYLISLVNFKTIPFKKILLLICVSLIYDLINTSIHYSYIRALNIPLAFATIGWIRSIIALASLIPLNTIGGLGIREISTFAIMTTNGVPPEMAVAFSLLNYLRITVLSLTGGIIELLDTLLRKVKKTV